MSEQLEKQVSQPEHLLEVRDLKQYFPIHTGWFQNTPLKAVDGVSFTIDAGETLGLVGESGCGKTTVGRSLLHLYKPTGGEVIYKGVRITPKNISQYRREMQIVFQDPYSSLNPRMTVERHRRGAAGHPPPVFQQEGAGRKDRSPAESGGAEQRPCPPLRP